ncbi:MAG TPA: hypothetical protein VLI71_02300 [Gammaproteobacteria bacterium]|nr:hypothetical protein [Gammaproteobacteria bacterium]
MVNDASVWTILVLFVLAWGAPLVLIVHYRLSAVPQRFIEIKDALIDSTDEKKSPGRQYLELFTRRETPKKTETETKAASADPSDKKKDGDPKKLFPRIAKPTNDVEQAISDHFYQFQSWTRYAMALVLLAAFSGGALFFVWGWTTQTFFEGTSRFGTIAPILPPEAVFALTGAFVWSLYELSQRARRRELTPDELFDVSIRYLFALPIGHLGALLSIDSVDYAFAFVATALPIRDLQRFARKRALEKMNVRDSKAEPTRAGYLAEVVDGLSPDTIARLEEIDIVSFTDLAYADPIRIMVKAGFSPRHIIQWMDHAMLGIYALPHKRKLAENAICCALDAKEFYEMHFKQHPECPAIAALVKATGVPAATLCEMFGRVAIDPQVQFLGRMWYTGYADGKELAMEPCPGPARGKAGAGSDNRQPTSEPRRALEPTREPEHAEVLAHPHELKAEA